MALFRRGRHWGAISKSNSPYLRYRDPIYRSLRELSLSFFPQYVRARRKTLRTYSVPVDLRRHDPALWVTRAGFCEELVDALTGARHFPLLPTGSGVALRPIDPIEARANTLLIGALGVGDAIGIRRVFDGRFCAGDKHCGEVAVFKSGEREIAGRRNGTVFCVLRLLHL